MATTIVKHETLVGKRIRRKEDPRLITGAATYVDDIQMPGMHHACILRSPHAAAKIRSLNVDSARQHPGVAAVFTGDDVKGVGPVPCGASLPGRFKYQPRPAPLARMARSHDDFRFNWRNCVGLIIGDCSSFPLATFRCLLPKIGMKLNTPISQILQPVRMGSFPPVIPVFHPLR